jgi:hypothetical protein
MTSRYNDNIQVQGHRHVQSKHLRATHTTTYNADEFLEPPERNVGDAGDIHCGGGGHIDI